MKIRLHELRRTIQEAYEEGNLPPDVQVLRDQLREQGWQVPKVNQSHWVGTVIQAICSNDVSTRVLGLTVWNQLEDGYLMLKSTMGLPNEQLQKLMLNIAEIYVGNVSSTVQMSTEEILTANGDPQASDSDLIQACKIHLEACRNYLEGSFEYNDLLEQDRELSGDLAYSEIVSDTVKNTTQMVLWLSEVIAYGSDKDLDGQQDYSHFLKALRICGVDPKTLADLIRKEIPDPSKVG